MELEASFRYRPNEGPEVNGEVHFETTAEGEDLDMRLKARLDPGDDPGTIEWRLWGPLGDVRGDVRIVREKPGSCLGDIVERVADAFRPAVEAIGVLVAFTVELTEDTETTTAAHMRATLTDEAQVKAKEDPEGFQKQVMEYIKPLFERIAAQVNGAANGEAVPPEPLTWADCGMSKRAQNALERSGIFSVGALLGRLWDDLPDTVDANGLLTALVRARIPGIGHALAAEIAGAVVRSPDPDAKEA